MLAGKMRENLCTMGEGTCTGIVNSTWSQLAELLAKSIPNLGKWESPYYEPNVPEHT